MSRNMPVFYLPLFLILVMVYSKSWLPLGINFLTYKEAYITLFFGLLFFLFYFESIEVLDIRFTYNTLEKKILTLLLIAILISTFFFNPNELFKFSYFLNLITYLVLVIIYFYLVPKYLIKNYDLFNKFIQIVSNFGLIFALLGFLFLFLKIQPERLSGNLVSLINNPNNTSIVLTMTFVPTLYYIHYKWKEFSLVNKICYVFSLILQAFAQLLTFTRAGMIATSVGLVIFFILHYRTKFLLMLPLFVVFTTTFGIFFFQAKGFASFISRFYLLIPAFQMITYSRERLLWGYGINNGLIEYKKTLVAFNPNEFSIDDPHNSYVTLAIMLGIVFTLILLVFVFLLFIKCLKRIVNQKDLNIAMFYTFLVASAASVLVQGLFDAELVKFGFYTIHYLMIIIGIMYNSLGQTFRERLPSLFPKK